MKTFDDPVFGEITVEEPDGPVDMRDLWIETRKTQKMLYKSVGLIQAYHATVSWLKGSNAGLWVVASVVIAVLLT